MRFGARHLNLEHDPIGGEIEALEIIVERLVIGAVQGEIGQVLDLAHARRRMDGGHVFQLRSLNLVPVVGHLATLLVEFALSPLHRYEGVVRIVGQVVERIVVHHFLLLGRCVSADPAAVFAALLEFGFRSVLLAAEAARALVTSLLVFRFLAIGTLLGAAFARHLS